MNSVLGQVCRWVAISAIVVAQSISYAQGVSGGRANPPPARDEPKGKPAAYVPPMRGAVAQVRRVGGATRGWGDMDLPLTVAIAPEHTGLTVNSAPTLYWYLSQAAPYPVVLTVIQEGAETPLLEREVESAASPGFHRFSLGEHRLSLEPGQEYEWSIAIVTDALDRSRDVIAQGSLLVVPRPADLATALKGDLDRVALSEIFLRHSLFYDAFDALSEDIRLRPGFDRPRLARRALLEQVGLPEVAAAPIQAATQK